MKDSGNTYSRAFGTTIGSGSLTTVFGMGTGVTFQIWSPDSSGALGREAEAHPEHPPFLSEGLVIAPQGVVLVVVVGTLAVRSPASTGDSMIGKRSIRVVKRSSVSTG